MQWGRKLENERGGHRLGTKLGMDECEALWGKRESGRESGRNLVDQRLAPSIKQSQESISK